MSIGLYIHVPFCHSRCHFCNFYLQIYRQDRAQTYLDALAREIQLHAMLGTLTERRFATVYFGGGTPTVLDAEQLVHILELIRGTFGLESDPEITLEAHPESVTAAGLSTLAKAGVNRISFGAQSMEADELRQVGRSASPHNTRSAVEMARQAGMANINLDLIYGLPGQTLESWSRTLEAALAMRPTHLSCYALTVEERTGLDVAIRRGTQMEPDSGLQLAMEQQAVERLAIQGFERYEISNFSRPGYACRHNLLYWQDKDYLGLGPSAQSFVDGCRFGNVEDLLAYSAELRAGRLPVSGIERLSSEQRRREAIIFGLRLLSGIELITAGPEPSGPDSGGSLDRLTARGWLEQHGGRLRLTESGRRFADSVAVELW